MNFVPPHLIFRPGYVTGVILPPPGALRENLRKVAISHYAPGGAPQTVSQLILNADGSESGYSSTYGVGVPVEQATFPDLSAFDFNAGQLLAGNVVHGRSAQIEAGQLGLYPLARSSGTVQIDSATLKPGAAVTEHVAQADTGSLDQARNDLANLALSPNQNGSTSCEYESVTSSSDASYKAGLSFGYLSAVKISNVFSSIDTSKSSHILIDCQEAFFTLSFSPDAASDGSLGLGGFFAPTVTVDSAQSVITPADPPLLVSEVTYGAQLYMVANSNLSTKQMEDDLNAAVSAASVKVTASLTAQQQSDLAQMDVHVLAIGGRASAQGGVDSAFSGGSAAQGLVSWLQATQDFSATANAFDETALPLSYQLNYLDFTPVAETASVNGDPTVGPNGFFQKAVVYFHSNGDGKDVDTTLDLAVLDEAGNTIGSTHIPSGLYPNNQDTSPVTILPLASGFTRGAIDNGYFDLLIHPVGHDTWKFTAYIALCYVDPNSGMNISTPNCPATTGTETEVDYRYSDRVSDQHSTKNVDDPSNGSHKVDSRVMLSAIVAANAAP